MVVAESILTIRHVAESDPPQFQVVHTDGRAADAVSVTTPNGYPVEGRPQSDLPAELAWYLEQFLSYPFSPNTEVAERVRAALKQWGTDAFATLFSERQASHWFDKSIESGLEQLTLRIVSDDPNVLAWPWEALCDQQSGTLAHTCRIERRLNGLADPVQLHSELPNDRVNVLLVVARPYEGDVRYRSIARPLVELIETERLPVEVTLLRPPTLDRLRAHLHERPGYYHLLHFDGHGGYGPTSGNAASGDTASGGAAHRNQPASPYQYTAEGRLVFEDEQGNPDQITAETLSTLLREYRLPAVVLNACQAAILDHQASDPFASVAAALLKAGIRSVVAMSYSLYVSAAQEFLPAFYRRLFDDGRFGEAVRGADKDCWRKRAGSVPWAATIWKTGWYRSYTHKGTTANNSPSPPPGKWPSQSNCHRNCKPKRTPTASWAATARCCS